MEPEHVASETRCPYCGNGDTERIGDAVTFEPGADGPTPIRQWNMTCNACKRNFRIEGRSGASSPARFARGTSGPGATTSSQSPRSSRGLRQR